MHDFTSLPQNITTAPRRSRRLKRGVCALAAVTTLGGIAGGTALAASASTALAGKTSTTVSPMGNSWR